MNAVQCDYCGKFAPNPVAPPYLVGKYTTKLPDDWYGLGAWKGGNGTMDEQPGDRGEFCSRKCISDHFAKPVAA